MADDPVVVDQALYGYADGHRLLGASIDLSGEPQRMLRSLTDVAFDGRATTYMTICPVPSLGAQAFIKTWPADSWSRPGSVWSHVLLVAFPEIGRLQGMQGIADAFRRPMPIDKSLNEREISVYRHPINVERTLHTRPSSKTGLHEVESRIYAGLYGGEGPVRVRVKNASEYENTLLAIFEQQWPRLRRTFSCRTRQRPSSIHMDLEIVERPASRDATEASIIPALGTWARLAVEDLYNPDPSYRYFLQVTGAESSVGRKDFGLLTEFFENINGPAFSPRRVTSLLERRFPAIDQQRALKRALFGASDETYREPIRLFLKNSAWPSDEESRVALAVAAAPWIDLADISLGQRLVRLYRSHPKSRLPLATLDLERIPMRSVQALVNGVAVDADSNTVIAIAVAQPDLGLLLVAQNKTMLGSSFIWDSLNNDLLLELLSGPHDGSLREFVLDQLLDSNAWEPIALICGAFPDALWALLIRSAHRDIARLVMRANTLRASLERLGTAALDSPLTELSSFEELSTLLLAADLKSGLWRRASVTDWISCATIAAADSMVTLPPYVCERVISVALVSASQSGSSTDRTRAWTVCFPYLHHALESHKFDSEAWSLLASTLPSGPDWDKCHRLRLGAANEMKKDRWSSDDISRVLDASAPYGDDLRSVLEERNDNGKDHWFKQVIKLFT